MRLGQSNSWTHPSSTTWMMRLAWVVEITDAMKPIFMAFCLDHATLRQKAFLLRLVVTARLHTTSRWSRRQMHWMKSFARLPELSIEIFPLPISHHSGTKRLRDHRKGDQVGRETVEGQRLGRPGLECSTFHGFCGCLCRYLSHKRWRSMQLLPGVDPRCVTFADMESLVIPLTEKHEGVMRCGVAVLELTLYWTSSATIFNPVMYLKVLSEGYFVKMCENSIKVKIRCFRICCDLENWRMHPGPKIASFLEMPRNRTPALWFPGSLDLPKVVCKSCAEFHPPKTLPFKFYGRNVWIVLEDTGAIFMVVFHVNYLHVYKNIWVVHQALRCLISERGPRKT